MHGAGSVYGAVANSTQTFSPITLNHEWPPLGRLLFMVICAFIGTIINGFYVSAFFVERTLNHIGYVFMACVGMADLIVTTVVMPVGAVVLLSGQWDTLPVCRFLQFMMESSTYCYSAFFTLVALESYYRYCRSTEEYDMFVSMRVGIVSFLVFSLGFLIAGFGVYLRLDYDYCLRKHFGNFYFRTGTSIIFHLVPSIITLYGLITASIHIRRRANQQMHYKRSQQYDRDYSLIVLNIVSFVMYVGTWVPYLLIVYEYPYTTDAKFYYSVWGAICRSVITNFLYSCFNRNFRRAFAHLFYYCCCKSTLTGSFNSRNRRGLGFKSGTGDVRVHIMHQAVNSSPQRASATRETQEL